jgi:ankyrin repeat protein
LKAVVNGNREIAEYLLEKTDRAVLKAFDRDGRSALHYAAAFAQVSMS